MTQARAIVNGLLSLALFAYGAQFFIELSSENLAAASIVLASSMGVLLYLMFTNALQTHPLSTFAIFGFCFTTQMGALIAQSATWTPIVKNLRQPIETYATLGMYLGIAICAHSLYRMFSRKSVQGDQQLGLVRSVLTRFGLYVAPSVGALWIMGLIGLASYAFSGGAGITSKLAQGFTFAAWAPFLIPVYVLQYGKAYCNVQRNYLFVAVYAGVIALLAITANARGMMLVGMMTIVLFAVLHTMRSSHKVKASQIAKVGLVTMILFALAVPMDYLMTAMGIARGVRNTASATKMVEETWYYIQQPKLLQAESERIKFVSLQSNYDETYFSSNLVGRLIETKFHDNALYFGSRLNDRDTEKLREVTADFFWGALPSPVLKALKIDVDKTQMNFSMGDYLSHLSGAGNLGGFKTGSGFAQGMAVFGYAFPAMYFGICIVLFLCIDLLATRNAQGVTVISALGALGIWRMFQYGISAESLHFLFIAVVRGVPQGIALYLLVYHVSRFGATVLSGLVGRRMAQSPQLAG
jgi:hypothetical protein